MFVKRRSAVGFADAHSSQVRDEWGTRGRGVWLQSRWKARPPWKGGRAGFGGGLAAEVAEGGEVGSGGEGDAAEDFAEVGRLTHDEEGSTAAMAGSVL